MISTEPPKKPASSSKSKYNTGKHIKKTIEGVANIKMKKTEVLILDENRQID